MDTQATTHAFDHQATDEQTSGRTGGDAPGPDSSGQGSTTPPPPAPPSQQASSGKGGLRLRSYVAIAATAALGAATVVVPAQFLDEDPAATTQATQTSVAADGDQAEQGTDGGTADSGQDVVPLPGAEDGSLIAEIAQRVLPSVVRINLGQGSGSGVVYDAEGHILTNAHVVQDADTVEVVTADGDSLEGTVLGRDPTTDIAVIGVDAELPVPDYSDAEPAIGALTVAIGSPFGLEGTVTSGIVSGLDRSLQGSTLSGLIQTDAAINPGNSGGALTNGAGEVIGINTAIISPSRSNAGIGFAVPTATAQQVADDIIEFGEVRAGFLGIEGQTVEPEVAELYNLAVDEGAVIRAVQPGSPAAEAGLEQGDIIVRFGDTEIASMAELATTVQAREPGETVTIGIVRDGEQLDVELTLGERPDTNG